MPKKIRGSTGGGIIPVQCADKSSEEDMQPPQSHWASQKRCEKVVICGPAHVGKSSLVKNLLVRSAPWAAVYVQASVARICPPRTGPSGARVLVGAAISWRRDRY